MPHTLGRRFSGALSFSETALVVRDALAMGFGALAEVIVVARTDRLAQAFEPGPGPGELDAEDCKSNRDDDQRGTGRHDHDDAEQQDGRTHNADDDAPCRLVREMNRFLNQAVGPSFLLRLAVALGR